MSGMGYSQLVVSVKSASEIHKALDRVLKDNPEKYVGQEEFIVNIPNHELHATLMYDKSNPNLDPGINREVYKARVTGVDRLGIPGKPYYALVLLLESDAIQKRFKELQDIGYEHSFPELKIHVSLHYGDSVDIGLPIAQEAFERQLLPEEITLGCETWEVCD